MKNWLRWCFKWLRFGVELIQRRESQVSSFATTTDELADEISDYKLRLTQLRHDLYIQVSECNRKLGRGRPWIPVMHTVEDELSYCEELENELTVLLEELRRQPRPSPACGVSDLCTGEES